MSVSGSGTEKNIFSDYLIDFRKSVVCVFHIGQQRALVKNTNHLLLSINTAKNLEVPRGPSVYPYQANRKTIESQTRADCLIKTKSTLNPR